MLENDNKHFCKFYANPLYIYIHFYLEFVPCISHFAINKIRKCNVLSIHINFWTYVLITAHCRIVCLSKNLFFPPSLVTWSGKPLLIYGSESKLEVSGLAWPTALAYTVSRRRRMCADKDHSRWIIETAVSTVHPENTLRDDIPRMNHQPSDEKRQLGKWETVSAIVYILTGTVWSGPDEKTTRSRPSSGMISLGGKRAVTVNLVEEGVASQSMKVGRLKTETKQIYYWSRGMKSCIS